MHLQVEPNSNLALKTSPPKVLLVQMHLQVRTTFLYGLSKEPQKSLTSANAFATGNQLFYMALVKGPQKSY
jgi:hypothetical protein